MARGICSVSYSCSDKICEAKPLVFNTSNQEKEVRLCWGRDSPQSRAICLVILSLRLKMGQHLLSSNESFKPPSFRLNTSVQLSILIRSNQITFNNSLFSFTRTAFSNNNTRITAVWQWELRPMTHTTEGGWHLHLDKVCLPHASNLVWLW